MTRVRIRTASPRASWLALSTAAVIAHGGSPPPVTARFDSCRFSSLSSSGGAG